VVNLNSIGPNEMQLIKHIRDAAETFDLAKEMTATAVQTEPSLCHLGHKAAALVFAV